MELLDETVKRTVTDRLVELENQLDGDVAFYYGAIDSGVLRPFRDFIERTAAASKRNRKRLLFLLNTPGGSAEAAYRQGGIQGVRSQPGVLLRSTMSLTDRLRDLLVEYPRQTPDRAELDRLREFTERMRDAGVVPTRTYDLPLPDTLGRGLVIRSGARSG